MDLNISDLLVELDSGFYLLGDNAVYKTEPRIVLPKSVEDRGLFDPPVPVHLGMLPVEEEDEDDNEIDRENQAEPQVGEKSTAEDTEEGTIPYIVVSKYDKWLRESEYDILYRGPKRLGENRALPLGVYFVPKFGNKPPAPEPHQLSPEETITFWVCPQEWRENKFIYMIRETFASPLLQLFELKPAEIPSVNHVRDHEKDEHATAVTEPEEDDVVQDGGWYELWNESDTEDTADMDTPPYIENITEKLEDNFDERLGTEYALDIANSMAVRKDLLQDLLGTSDQVEHIRTHLSVAWELWEPQHVDGVDPEDVLRIILEELLDAEGGEVTSNDLLKTLYNEFELDQLLVFGKAYNRAVNRLTDAEIIEQIPTPSSEHTDENTTGTVLRLNVRPTAVHAALELADSS